VSSRQARPVPVPGRDTRFLAFHGTADPLVPYQGGPIGLGRLVGRGGARRPAVAGRGVAAPIEEVAADWSPPGPDGTHAAPRREPVAGPPGALPVERLS